MDICMYVHSIHSHSVYTISIINIVLRQSPPTERRQIPRVTDTHTGMTLRAKLVCTFMLSYQRHT